MEVTRKYKGELITASNYKEILEKEGREGVNFHTKHLRAYKQGKDSFQYGWYTDDDGDRRPLISRVKQEIILSFDNEKGQPQIRNFGSQADMRSYLKKKADEKHKRNLGTNEGSKPSKDNGAGSGRSEEL